MCALRATEAGFARGAGAAEARVALRVHGASNHVALLAVVADQDGCEGEIIATDCFLQNKVEHVKYFVSIRTHVEGNHSASNFVRFRPSNLGHMTKG